MVAKREGMVYNISRYIILRQAGYAGRKTNVVQKIFAQERK